GVRSAVRRFGRAPEPSLVEDLTQEAYCRLVEDGARRLRTFRGTVPAELAAWLRRLAERTAFDHLRAAAARKRGGDRVLAASAIAAEPEAPGTCPQCRIEQRERLREFARRCRALTGGGENARILKLVLVVGWTTCDVVRASRGTVSRSRVDSLVYRLRRRLEEEGTSLAVRGSEGRRTGSTR
ncbi:MAG: sigma factor, partial [Acidobacteriota bacterium]